MTINEAAAYLKVSKQTIHKLKNSGKIKFHKTGNKILFTYEDLSIKFFQTKDTMALCNISTILVDKETNEVLPFEKGNLYKIVNENWIWISLFNEKWNNSIRISKNEFRKYFSVVEG